MERSYAGDSSRSFGGHSDGGGVEGVVRLMLGMFYLQACKKTDPHQIIVFKVNGTAKVKLKHFN